MEGKKEYSVTIPDEHFKILEFKQEGSPGIAVINHSLTHFEPKEVFAWHCSIMLQCENLIENEMPSTHEIEILDKFENYLNEKIRGDNKNKPNGLFLARITWNRTRELIWRIYNPELTNNFLTDIIKRRDYLRSFDYRIDPDKEWHLAEWHLKNS